MDFYGILWGLVCCCYGFIVICWDFVGFCWGLLGFSGVLLGFVGCVDTDLGYPGALRLLWGLFRRPSTVSLKRGEALTLCICKWTPWIRYVGEGAGCLV